MAQLFQVELIRLSWLQKKQVKDTLSYPACDHLQSFMPGRVLPRYLSSSSSALLPIFCTSSNTQPELKARSRRSARSTMRDAQLCKELQLFLSSQGLPCDKVPSTKELSKCGREDLAKIVRRRGYKAIQALLADSDSKQGNVQEDNGVHRVKDNVTEALIAVSDSKSLREKQLPEKPGTPDDTGQTLESNIHSFPRTLQENAKVEAAPEATASPIVKLGEEELRRRAAEFVRTGRLEQLPDSDDEEEEDENGFLEDSSDEDDDINTQNGPLDAQGIAVEKAAILRAKLLPFLKGNVPGELNNQVADSILGSSQGLKFLEELNQVGPQTWRDSTSEADLELQEIKSALVNKERELREVSRDLEETKAQLALIQAKATAEVAQAKQLALEKDLRLKSADLALANLKRVQVEYWGEGERVELAGSFNGWRYFILMEPDPTSEITKPDGSRGPMMWGTELWLYPGVYEIKFIIDGVWQIDQRREIVTRNSHHNNLLRVEP